MLDKNDKKIKSVMAETLKELVLPRLDKIEKKLDATMEAVAETKVEMTILKDDVSGLKKDTKTVKEDIKIIKEDVNDLGTTSNRIETLTKSEIKYVDDLSGRVLKLETKKA